MDDEITTDCSVAKSLGWLLAGVVLGAMLSTPVRIRRKKPKKGDDHVKAKDT